MTILMAAALAVAAEGRRPPPSPADPLTVMIETEDADRFTALFDRTKGRPTAEQLQRDYLDPGSYGVQVFTPDRIQNAANLAAAVAARPEVYAKAIHVCLPIAKETTAELRATYLAFRGLFPDRALPHLYLVLGQVIRAARPGLALKCLVWKCCATLRTPRTSCGNCCAVSTPMRRFTPSRLTLSGSRRAALCSTAFLSRAQPISSRG